jgi:drug/metabolite transporter (DMT)-like permease
MPRGERPARHRRTRHQYERVVGGKGTPYAVAVTPAALVLVFGAAVLHAGWNALAKRGGDPLAFLWCAGALGTLLYAPAAAWVLWREGLPLDAAPFVIATILLHAVYFFTLGRAYRVGDYSLVYPVARGLGVALVPGLAFVFLGERLSVLGAVGVGLVVLGIFALHGSVRALGKAAGLAPGTGWAVATGAAIAAYSLVDKAGVARAHPVVYIWLMEVGASLLLAPAAIGREGAMTREWRSNGRAIALAAVMSPGGYLLVLFAFQLSKAAYVVASREISIVLSTLIGSLLMAEGALGRRLAGAIIVLAGVGCVALAR